MNEETQNEEPTNSQSYEVEGSVVLLTQAEVEKLRSHQDFSFALIGGLVIAIFSAVIWAVITVTTKYQIGYMAIGLGFLVGFAVRFFGAGIDKKFGILGALLSLVGCLLGNLFSQVGFYANDQSVGYIEVLRTLNLNLIIDVLSESFQPMDFFFYAFAIYEGYKFAFRKFTNEDIAKVKMADEYAEPPFTKYRLPLVIGSIAILLVGWYFLAKGENGKKVRNYESGHIMSEGEVVDSKEHGKWIYYYENGSVKSEGFYNMGTPDSLWNWFEEDGKLNKVGRYKNGLEHGVWISYYKNGNVSDSGNFIESRMYGYWVTRYENGAMAQCCFYKRNMMDGVCKYFYENGNLSSTGNMKEGKAVGEWSNYFENGQKSEEISYQNDQQLKIINAWDKTGKQMVVNGNGNYTSVSKSGTILLQGQLKDGLRSGKWLTFYETGKKQEEGNYENEVYRISNAWDSNGEQMVKDGNGIYTSYYLNGTSKYESGEIKDGLRVGDWKLYYESNGNVYQEMVYMAGKVTGRLKSYYETGEIATDGEMVNGLKEGEWKWYYITGTLSSSVNFIHDKKDGKQILWSEVGKETKEEVYENGVLIEEKML